jgi:signal peptide peptidase SppA
MATIKKNNNSHNTMVEIKGVKQARRSGKIEQLLSCVPFIGQSKPVVAVMRLDGIIGKVSSIKSGLTLSSLNQRIEKIFKIERLDAICLCINSPGGSPVQSELIANRIISLAKEKDIQVFSFVEDVAASGGYWLACAGNKIFASRSSIIGSIGVISSGFGFQHAIEKIGVERRVYTEGKSKSVLDPFQPVKESDIKIITALQKNIHEHFINHVKERRAGRITQSDDIIFNGEFWNGQTALDFGLIDGIDNLYSFIERRYGDDVKLEYIEEKQSWLQKKFSLTKLSNQFASDLADNLVPKTEEKIACSKFNFW